MNNYFPGFCQQPLRFISNQSCTRRSGCWQQHFNPSGGYPHVAHQGWNRNGGQNPLCLAQWVSKTFQSMS